MATISELCETDLHTSFSIKFSFENTYSNYIKLDKYNIRFRILPLAARLYKLQCQIHDEKCQRHTSVQDTVTASISVESSPRPVKMFITGPIKDNIDLFDVNHTEFKIELSISQPQHTLKTKSDDEILMDFKLDVKESSESTLTRMYDDETFMDFKLVVKKSSDETVVESVGFHRAVLAAWSPVMMNMFTNDWKEKNEGVLKLPVTLEVLKAFKKYIYTYKLPADRETLLGLAELGSYYMDPKLEIGASKAIFKLILPEEIVETLGYSMAKKLNKLTKLLIAKIRTSEKDNYDQVIKSID